MESNLLLALLSLDAYNRGKTFGINVASVKVGPATAIANSADNAGVYNANFSATTYKIDGTQNYVISYRGTDDLLGDASSGYLSVTGSPDPQAEDAITYYRSTLASYLGPTSPYASGITVTGHSLGGGLAGLVASLYNLSSNIYNNMPFQAAAQAYHDAALADRAGNGTAAGSDLDQLIYSGLPIQDLALDEPTTYTNVYDPLEALRILQSSPAIREQVGNMSAVAAVSGTGHSIATEVALIYAADNGLTGWVGSSEYLWDAFNSNEVANHVSGLGDLRAGAQDTAAQAMEAAIGYSAVAPDLSDDTKPFGDTALASMFDDAADLSSALDDNHTKNSALTRGVTTLASLTVAYAGDLATGDVLASANPSAAQGILGTGSNANALTVDFTSNTWDSSSEGPPADYKAQLITDSAGTRADALAAALGRYEIDAGLSQTSEASIDGSYYLVSSVNYQTKLAELGTPHALPAGTADLLFLADGGSGADTQAIPTDTIRVIVAADCGQSLIGHDEDDVFVGGSGKDVLVGGGGANVLVGGSDDDTIQASSSDNFLEGDDGSDTFQIMFSSGVGGRKGDTIWGGADGVDATTSGTHDEVDYSSDPNAIQINLSGAGAALGVSVLDGNGNIDDLHAIENIKGTSGADVIKLTGDIESGTILNIDESSGSGVTIDLRAAASAVHIKLGQGTAEIFSTATGGEVTLTGSFTKILGSHNGDTVEDEGAGSNQIDCCGGNDKLLLANGDAVTHLGAGSHITFGVPLAGGKRHVSADAPESESGTYTAGGTTYNYDQDVHTLTVSNSAGSITLTDFTNGDDHIVLSTKRDPKPTPDPAPPLPPPPPTPPPGFPHFPPNPRDPLVLDLVGAGINLMGLVGSTAYFDYTSSGYRQLTGWVTAGEGLLVTKPRDGQTITRNELLGAVSGSGFTDLLALDSNGDGVIDASDPAFQTLAVWIDSGLDGISGAGELYTLDALGIASISVGSVASPYTGTVNGNEILATGTFTNIDGSQHQVAEVNFGTNRQYTIVPSNSNVKITPAAAALPNLVGYGSLPNLRVTMSLDPTLLGEVQNLVVNSASLSAPDFEAAFEQIVQRWADASSVDPDSEGAFVDARHLAVDYAFYGIDPAADPTYQILPNGHTGPSWEGIYRSIISELKVRFASQIFSSLDALGASDADQLNNPYRALSALDFDPTTDRFGGDVASVFKFVTALEPRDSSAAAAYWAQIEPMLVSLNLDVASATKLLIDAANAHFTFEQLTSLASHLGLPVEGPDGVVSVEGTTIFLATSQSHSLDASRQTIVLPDYYQATTAFYRVATTDDLAIKNLSTGSVLTLIGYFTPTKSYFTTIEAAGDTIHDLGALIALSAAADIGANSDTPSKEATLQTLQYQVVSDPAALVPTNGSVAYEVNGTSSLTVSGDGDGIGANILFFANGTKPHDVVVSQAGMNNGDLILTDTVTGQVITITNQGNEQQAHIQEVVFEDGTSWSAGQLWAMSEATGTQVGAPLIVAHYAQDSLVAGVGNVELQPEIERTTFTTGCGNDKLDLMGQGNVVNVAAQTVAVEIAKAGGSLEGFHDPSTLFLPSGLSASDLQVSIDSNTENLILSFNNGPIITIDNGIEWYAFGQNPIDRVAFADGTSFSIANLIQMSIESAEASGNDTVFCLNTGNGGSFIAGPGNVELDAFWFSGYGPVILTAGTGTDTLAAASQANTTFVIPLDATNVTLVQEQDYGTQNTIEFGPGVLSDDIGVFKKEDGSYVFLNTATGGSVTLHGAIHGDGQSWQHNQVYQITFADGTTWDASDVLARIQTVEGTSEDDFLQAPDGCATVLGNGGNDTLVAGAGSDILIGGGGSTSFVISGHAHATDVVEATGSSGDIWLPQPFAIGQLTLHGIAATDVTMTLVNNGDDIVLAVAGTGQTIDLVGEATSAPVVNGIGFDDGTVWALAKIDQMVGLTPDPSVIQGTMGDDTIQAGPGNVTVYGNGGNDTLIASDGDDTLVGGPTGHSSFRIGADAHNYTVQARDLMPFWKNGQQSSGDLRLTGITPTDVSATAQPNGSDILLTVLGSSETILLQDELTGTPVVNSVTFDDGTTWSSQYINNMTTSQGSEGGSGPTIIQGTSGNDVLRAGAGDTTIYGNGGNDTLVAGAGNDTLIGGPTGYTIFEIGAASYSYDVEAADLMPSWKQGRQSSGELRLSGISPGSIQANSNGQDVILTVFGTGEQITLQDELTSTPVVTSVSFDDGTSWTSQYINDLVSSHGGGSGPSVIQGTSGHDVLQAGSGDTTIYGNGGNDTLASGPGNDTLVGGPTGHTIFEIGAASYSYAVQAADLMPSWKQGQQSSGELRLSGISPDSVQANSNGEDVVLTVVGTGEQITLQDELTSTPVVTSVSFGDGTSWTSQQLAALAGVAQVIDVTSGPLALQILLPTSLSDGEGFLAASGSVAFQDVVPIGAPSVILLGEVTTGTVSDDIANGSLNQALTFSNLTETTDGSGSVSSTFQAPGSAFDYLAAGQSVNLTYTYEIDDGAYSAQQMVSVSIQKPFDAPTVTSTANFTTDDESTITVASADLLATVSVSDTGDAISLKSVHDAVGGSVFLNSDGSVIFTPDPTFTGAATFEFNVSDSTGSVVEGVASVQVATHLISGASGDDELSGDASPATIDGRGGNDILTAGSSGDILIAGAGNDTLVGGAGADTFSFGDTFGNAAVQNFTTGGSAHDVLSFSTSVFADWAHLLGATQQSGSDLLITASNGSTITLQNVQLSAFASNDARFD